MKSIYLILTVITLAVISSCSAIAVMSIDLGNEWLKIAVVCPGKPMEIVLNKESRRKTAVAVAFRKGERFIGDSAMSTAVRFPANAYHHFLDLVGKTIDHPEVKRFQARFPYHKITGLPDRNSVLFNHIDGLQFTPEELLSMLIKKSQEMAEESSEQKITDCVITVPPYFNQVERRAIVLAAELAGLKVLQLINVNSAAALNYGVFRRKHFNSTSQNIMLYDMGAADTIATIVSYQVVKMKEGSFMEENPQLSIKGIGFERNLGGLEMQLRLRDHLARKFNEQKKTKTDVFSNTQALSKLFKEAGRLKHVLSANDHFVAQIEGLIEDIDFKAKVTREEFIELIKDMLDKVSRPAKVALEAAGMSFANIDQLILVGGGTRVPSVQENLGKFYGKELGKNLNTDEAPAMGAAYQAAFLSTGFKVKKFAVKESNIFPIQVDFSRDVTKEDGSVEIRQIKRLLFSHQNPYPQKKVMTFNKHTDDFYFYVSYGGHIEQYIGEESQPVSKNITKVKLKGVNAALQKHTGDDIESKGIKAHFRMDESGILHLDQIEAEFKKTVISEEEPSTFSKIGSTISNLFSGGSADDKKDEEKKEDKTEASDKLNNEKVDKPSNETENLKPNDNTTSATNTTSDSKKETKHIFIKESIKISKKQLDIPNFTDEHQKAMRNSLEKFESIEKKKRDQEVARNNLESYIFDMLDKLDQENYVAASTEKERDGIRQKCTDASNWLDEESQQQEAEVYKAKLANLKQSCNNMSNRVKEHEERPEAWKALHDTLNISSLFLANIKNVSSEESVFTDVEIESFEKMIEETTKWAKEMKAEQDAVPLFETPKVSVFNIAEKIKNLDREIKYLLNKAKLAPPKPKKDSKAENETSTKNETNSTDKSDDSKGKEETLELPDVADSTTENTEAADKASNEKSTPSSTENEEHSEL